jgi:1-acyl-sn-glycerol-3-phosphate acyltransferase
MSVDRFEPGDKQAFVGFSPKMAQRFHRWINQVGRALNIEIEGLEHIPKGRALLVANHAFGWDVMFPMAAVWERLGRPVWVLGEHLWWKLPFLRKLAASVGTVDGTRENAGELLEREQLVLVLPGGLREAVKPRELRYQLLWGHRYGFVRTAVEHQAPIVPLASVGTDELFDFVGNPYARGARWLGRSDIPVPLPSRILPIPHKVQMRFVFGEPIQPRARPEDAANFEVVRSVRREVEGALHELIELELAKRAGIDLDPAR